MNREIKFRVWDATEKEYNYDIVVGNILSAIHGSGDPLSEEEEEQFTLQQYTGLKDKNGVEIYEVDILAYISYSSILDKAPIVFSPICLAYVLDTSGRHLFDDKYGDYLHLHKDRDYEVVGNIMENPELLKA